MTDNKTTGDVGEIASSKFQWRIKKFSSITDKKLYSDIFNVGASKWRLLVFPKGNQVDYLSIYLAVADAANLPSGWTRKAKFSLSVINQPNSKATVRKETTHEFNAKEVDWGFTSFVPLSKIREPNEKFLLDDTLIIEAEVTVSNLVHPSVSPTLIIEAEVTVGNLVHPSVSAGPKKPEQQSIKAPPPPPPPPPMITKEKELPKDRSVEPKESSQDVQTKSKNLLTELSSRTTTQRSSSTNDISVSPQPDNLQQKNEALAGFFNMSLEAIQQANVFGNIEEIIRTLIPNTNDLQKKTALEDLASRLKEFQEIIPTAKATVEAAENRRKSLLEKTTKLDSKLAESREKLISLDSELSKISNEVEKIEAEIQRLTAQKEKLLVEKKNVVAQLEKANPEALKDLEEWKKLEEEMKQANAEWLGAKEKSALANIRWKLYREELGL